MDFTRLDAFLDKLTAWRIPGNDCIIMKDGEVIYRHMSGFADREAGRLTEGNETYNMWSTSKPITCAAAMTLYEKGAFLMTDPLSDYLPEYADVTVEEKCDDGTTRLVKPKRKITISDIMSMTAGFDYTMDSDAIKAVKSATGGRCPTRDIVRAMATHPLQAHPGSRWIYSICYDILGGLVEVVSGKRFSEYVKEVIFDPLEMNDSTFETVPPERLRARMSRQYFYNYDRDCAVPTDNSCAHKLGTEYESGGAGLTSTVEDYIKFAYAMANGGVGVNGNRILAASTVDLIRANALSEAQVREVDRVMHLTGYGYGYGVRTLIDPALAGTGAPVGEFGWAGAAGTWVMIDPSKKLALFYAEHLLESQESYFAPRLRNITYSCLED